MKRTSLLRSIFYGLAVISLVACGTVSVGPTATPIPANAGNMPAATAGQPDLPSSSPAPADASEPPSSGVIQVYFSRPAGSDQENGLLEEAVLEDLQAAESSIDMAMYNLSLRRVADALIEAHRRGVAVRVVTDSGALDNTQFERLIAAGVEVHDDRQDSLMHDKFLIIDRRLVWTGSLNLTGSGAYQDDNNFVRFSSTDLAQNYTAEFTEMFVGNAYGANSPSHTPHRQLEIEGAPTVNLFAPEDNVSPILVDLIETAGVSIDVLAYSFTSDPLAKAIESRHAAGVAVRMVFDEASARNNTGGEYLRLRRAGLDARLDGNEGLMHHKVIILDGETVIFGSYNFTANANRQNDENVLIIQSETLAGSFINEFERIYAAAQSE